MAAFNRAVLDSMPNLSIYIEAVHRLTDLGAVVTHVAHGVSQEGFDAEWRMIFIFDGRRRPDQPLRAIRRGRPRCCAREVRRAQSAGAAAGERGKPSGRALSGEIRGPRLGRHGRDTGRRHFDRRSSSRGGRRASDTVEMPRSRTCGRSPTSGSRTSRRPSLRPAGGASPSAVSASRAASSGPEAFYTEVLGIVEINADNRIAARIMFDPDDLDAAFEELDARYLAGEAAAYSHTWSVIARSNAAFNRRELPSAASRLGDTSTTAGGRHSNPVT